MMEAIISGTSARLLAQYDDLIGAAKSPLYPDTDHAIAILYQLRTAIFPGCYPIQRADAGWHKALLADICQSLTAQIRTAFWGQMGEDGASRAAADIAGRLIDSLGDVQQLLYKDAKAGFDGDPAARDIDEVIMTYPGFFAVFVYRIAHFLYQANVPYIPRIMSEHAHSITGIDINPGARIGEYFFIDHGTGVVIGETAIIGNNVKLYQGVTLGALTTRKGQQLAGTKRHPTIEDNVIIYSGATILGGNTVIGHNSIIGGNVFIIESVPPHATVRDHSVNPN